MKNCIEQIATREPTAAQRLQQGVMPGMFARHASSVKLTPDQGVWNRRLALWIPDAESDVLGTRFFLYQSAHSEYPETLEVLVGSSVEYFSTRYTFTEEGVEATSYVGIAEIETAGPTETPIEPPTVTDFDLGMIAGQLQAAEPLRTTA